MPIPYAGQHLSFPDQVQLLAGRGLAVTDARRAAQYLERIGYYRLKSYWFPFRETTSVQQPGGRIINVPIEDFRPGTKFEYAVELYVFDKKLRLLMLDAIERVEVAIRVDLAHALGQRDPWAHRNLQFLDHGAAQRHANWLQRADTSEANSRLDWVQEYVSSHGPPLPIWMAVETWDFGTLSKLFQLLHQRDRSIISNKYGVRKSAMFASWLRTLNEVRNICAHHARLWNHPLVNQPTAPGQDVPLLSHLQTYTVTQTRVYAAAALCQYFLGVISPNSTWKDRLKALWAQFPGLPTINSSQAGFMPAWRSWPLWQ